MRDIWKPGARHYLERFGFTVRNSTALCLAPCLITGTLKKAQRLAAGLKGQNLTINKRGPRLYRCPRPGRIAHEHGVPLIVDNTFATPVNCRPFAWGADIVIHSTTKYMDGHGAAVGGVIVDSGRFDWMKSPDKYPGLTRPDESYHGLVFTERFGLAGAYITKAVTHLMRDIGAVQSPVNAYMLNLGLESLHLRIKRHCENGDAVAKYLAAHPKIEYVKHCSLPDGEYYQLAQKYLANGSCGVVSLGVAGGRGAAERFMNSLKRCIIATHVSDARSCVLHPASSTHRQMTDEQLVAAGIRPNFVRLSVGIEDIGDLLEDIGQALDTA